jgi:hypothetical protein
MKHMGLIGVAAVAVFLAGCESIGTAAQSKTVQGGVLGSALGAGAGAIIGHQTGHAGEGAAIGAGLGALGGGLVGHGMEEQSQAASQQQIPPAAGKMKICPVGGELYGENVKYCPNHGVELRYKEQ